MTVADFLSLRQWLLAVGFTAGPLAVAQAQMPVLTHGAPWAELIETVAGQHREQNVAVDMAESGTTVIEILSGPGGETLALLYSLVTGQSSVIAGGRHWEIYAAATGPET